MTDSDITAIRGALADEALPRQRWAWGTFSRLLVVPLDERGHTNKHDPVCVIPSDDFPHQAEATAKADYIAACHPERIARLLDALESAQRLQPVLVPQPDDCEVDYSTGHQVGYAQGWNAAVAAMKDAP